MKFIPQNIAKLFDSTKRAERSAQAKIDAALATVTQERERLVSEREIVEQFGRFQTRLLAYHRQLKEFQDLLADDKSLADYEVAVDQAVAVAFGFPERNPLNLEQVAERLNVYQNRAALLASAERFVAKLETEVTDFTDTHGEVLQRHGAVW